MDEFAKSILTWLQRRVAEAEANDPQLRPKKDRINEITKLIESASEDEAPGLLKLQNDAIQSLVDHVASKQ